MLLDFEEVCIFINKKIENEEDITVEECCIHFNYSYSYFSRLFKRKLGFSPSSYITAARIGKTVETLLDPSMNVSDAYNKVLYRSSSSFTKCFRKHMGLSPKKYKEKSQELSNFVEKAVKSNCPGEMSYCYIKDLTGYLNKMGSLKIKTVNPVNKNVNMMCVGLYPDPLALGKPIFGKAVFNKREVLFESVPYGDYYVFISGMEEGTKRKDYFYPKILLRGRTKEPVKVKGDKEITVELKEHSPGDYPIVLHLPKIVGEMEDLTNCKD